MAADRISLEIEIYIHVLSESGRVVISVRFCIPKGFQYRIRLNENIFYSDIQEKIILNAKNITILKTGECAFLYFYLPTVNYSGLQNLNDIPFYFLLTTYICDRGDVFHNNFTRFCLARSRFSAYYDTGISTLLLHFSMHRVSNRENVRWIFK